MIHMVCSLGRDKIKTLSSLIKIGQKSPITHFHMVTSRDANSPSLLRSETHSFSHRNVMLLKMCLKPTNLKMASLTYLICMGSRSTNFSLVAFLQPKLDVTFEDGGGWLVILSRKADVQQQVSFNHWWDNYVWVFGDLNTEFWYGLCNIHCLTTS